MFLNPDRPSFPDIDIDLDYDKRHLVIHYVQEKYGKEYVAAVGTFNTFGARSAIDCVGKALGLSIIDTTNIKDCIPDVIGISLEEAMRDNETLSKYVDLYPQLFEIALKLEGKPRAMGHHACGVVITPKPLNEMTAVRHAKAGATDIVSHLDLSSFEKIGGVKIDFLGLKNLSIIRETLEMCKEEINIDNINLSDPRVFETLSSGVLSGIFQFEKQWAGDLLKDLKPTEFNHIIAAGALLRPGPLESGATADYIQRKNGLKPVLYAHEDLRETFLDTYGVMVYQEQVMALASKLAGYTMAEADSFRSAIGKKNKEKLEQELIKFKQRSIERGYEASFIDNLSEDIEKHARYSFNKCIAGCQRFYGYRYSVEEMYKIKNDIEYVKKYHFAFLNKQYNSSGYPTILSLDSNNKTVKNKIKNISIAGIQKIYNVETENGSYVSCTSNHKFPTPYGEKKLSELTIDSELYTSKGLNSSAILDKIVSINYIDTRMTYDVEMEGPNHNFLTDSGLVVSNSHAAGYGMITYQTAWLKTYYPVYFMTAIMCSRTDLTSLEEYIRECKRLHIKVLGPDVNKSQVGFSVEKQEDNSLAIRYAIEAIKGLGASATAVKDAAPCESFKDFFFKVNRTKVNKKTFLALIDAGAFDDFNPNRKEIYKEYMALRKEIKSKDKYTDEYGKEDPELIDTTFDPVSQAQREFTVLGSYIVSKHPVSDYVNDDIDLKVKGEKMIVSGSIVSHRKIVTKKGDDMCFLDIDTPNGHVDIIVFPKLYAQVNKKIKIGKIITVHGTLEKKNRAIADTLIDGKLKD